MTDEGANISIVDFDTPHRAHCLSVLGWIVAAAEMSGAKVQYAEEERCRTRGDDVCMLVARWTD
jgi:hypothetical protein